MLYIFFFKIQNSPILTLPFLPRRNHVKLFKLVLRLLSCFCFAFGSCIIFYRGQKLIIYIPLFPFLLWVGKSSLIILFYIYLPCHVNRARYVTCRAKYIDPCLVCSWCCCARLWGTRAWRSSPPTRPFRPRRSTSSFSSSATTSTRCQPSRSASLLHNWTVSRDLPESLANFQIFSIFFLVGW